MNGEEKEKWKKKGRQNEVQGWEGFFRNTDKVEEESYEGYRREKIEEGEVLVGK